jgi:lipoprotein-anchoring transpeptidase ErfK/SrfK
LDFERIVRRENVQIEYVAKIHSIKTSVTITTWMPSMQWVSFRRAMFALGLSLGIPVNAVAQMRLPLDVISLPTVEDVEPGVDHGSSDDVLPHHFRRQPVSYRTDEAPGTIIVDTSERFLYVIQSNNIALRYGIGVGRDGFTWTGVLRVTGKAEWPDWTPPEAMIERQPYLPRWMAGGPGNPLGARTLYLGDTLYRIHGTNAPETIGHAVSSGCFRLVNDDVVDLYERIQIGAKVIVQY